jgi:dihydroflavonol-4-reductase
VKTVLVTGATGLIGANICVQLVKRGDKARTIARKPDGADARALKKLGVEVIGGDITDRKCVEQATRGVQGVIHSAALRGIPGATNENSLGPNTVGTINVLSAAWAAGNVPVLQVLTATFFDGYSKSMSESSPLDKNFLNTDPYSLTKRLAYVEGMVRVKEGQDIRFMLPGAGYGTTPCLENGMFHPSFNSRIQLAIKGELNAQMPMMVPYVTGEDCAFVCVAALDKGTTGERYMAYGRQQDADTIANICNLACRVAGVKHRVEEVPRDKLDDPAIIAKYGQTMPTLAKRIAPKPLFDSSFTEKTLGYKPTPLDEGLKVTLDWMRQHKFI